MPNESNPLDVATGKEHESLAFLLKSDAYSRRFEQVLRDRAPQFVASLISIGKGMTDVEPRSIIGAGMTAACLDLPIDKNLGFAWIVPFRDKHQGGKKVAQFQMGYKGYIQLGQRSGQYSRMNAMAINREVFKGWDVVGEPVLDWDQYDPDKEIWGYFFGFQLTNGFTKSAVWTKEKVLVHAKRFSQSFRAGKDVWVEQFDGMALKTVIANTLRKWGPLSIQVQRALTSDQAVIRDADALPEYIDGNDAEQLGDKPLDEHPEQKKQREAEAAAATEAAKEQERIKAEVQAAVDKEKLRKANEIIEKITGLSTAVKEDEKAEAAMGLAPEEPKKEEPKPEPATAPATPEPSQPPELKPGQAALKKEVEAAGYTFADFINTFAGKAAGIPKKTDPTCPKEWYQFDESKAAFCVKSIKGVIAAMKAAKGKG